MKRKKHVELIALFLIIILAVAFSSLYISLRVKTASGEAPVKIYFYDPIAKELVPEERIIKGGSDNYLFFKAFDALKTPDEKNLFPVIFDDASLNSAKLEGELLTLDLKIDEAKLNSLTLKREFVFVYGIVNTFTEFKGVSSVKILVNGKERTLFSHYIEISKPLIHFSQSLPRSTEVNLYFVTQDMEHLAVERREIFDEGDPVKKCKIILSELFSGSRYGLPNLFNEGILESFSLKSGGNAEVSLISSKLPKAYGSNLEKLFVLSIVNSLTEIRDVQSVSVLVDDKPVDTLLGSVFTGGPLKRFFENSQKFAVPYYYFIFNNADFYIPNPIPLETITVDKVFDLLQNPPSGFETKIPKSAEILEKTIKENTLEMSIALGFTPTANDLDIIRRQVVLSFTEIPNIDKIKLNIGEETFILTR